MKSTYTIIPALLGLALTSCSKFLDEKPQSDITQESTQTTELVSAYKTSEQAESELNGVYALFKSDIYEGCLFYIGECMSDNCYIGGDGVPEEQIGNMSVTATNSMIDLMWGQYYSIIGSATTVIENVKLMTEDQIDKTKREQIIASAKFARAWALFDVVRYWGDAPMTLQLIPSITVDNIDKWYPVMYPERTSAEQIYAQIIEDLDDKTISALPSLSKGSFGASRGAAYGLLAKVYATMGDKSSRDYGKVVELCQNVEDEGYSLVGNFDDLWTVDGKLSGEGIFELYFSDVAEQHNWAYWVLLSDISGDVVVSWRRYCTPTQQTIAKFDQKNDARFKSSIYWAKVPYDIYYPADNYPLAYKIRQKENDIILMRLADILLLKAEAYTELGESGKALRIVNRIRTRAGINELPLTLSQQDTRLAVENERQLELFLEGHRWFDILRNDRMEEVMLGAKDKNGKPRYTDIPTWRRLMPIPQGQMDINERLTQNEGY